MMKDKLIDRVSFPSFELLTFIVKDEREMLKTICHRADETETKVRHR